MSMKKLYTFDDLYSFFLTQNQNVKFSSKDSNTEIVVQVLGSLAFDKNVDYKGLTPVHLQACHTEKNRNGSYISAKTMKNAFPTFKNRPILAFIHEIENEDGEKEEVFGWHAMHEDEDGELVYDERMVGIIPESSNPTLKYDEDKKKYYVNIDGYLYDEYTHAKDILERMGEASVSIEINVLELSYDAQEKVLMIDDFYLSGITILGKDFEGNDVEAGMEGSNIKLTDFSKEHNSMVNTSADLLEAIVKLNNTLSSFNIESLKKGGEGRMNKFEELLSKYNKTIDDIDFEYEELSDEELESKFKEKFGETENSEDNTTPPAEGSEENFEDNQSEDENEDKNEDENFEDSSENEADNEDEEDNSDSATEYSIEYSVNKKTFKTSLNDIQYALTVLVNDTYSESDNTYYSCIVYEDCVVMVDAWTGVAYRQGYKARKDVYSLVGDRVPVKAVYLTADEEAEVDKMKKNYSSYQNELQQYHNVEAQAAKQDIINKSEFAFMSGQFDDYDNFVNEINDNEKHLNYSIEEVQSKCDQLLLAFVKAGNQINFNRDKTEEPKRSKVFRVPEKTHKTKSRYGNLFKNVNNK